MTYKYIRHNEILTYPPAFIVLKLSYVYYIFCKPLIVKKIQTL